MSSTDPSSSSSTPSTTTAAASAASSSSSSFATPHLTNPTSAANAALDTNSNPKTSHAVVGAGKEDGENAISVDHVYGQCRALVRKHPQVRLARNMLSRNALLDVLRDQDTANTYTYTYSHSLELQGKATSQGSSGRCWIFACLNVIRLKLIKKLDLPKDFELSQSYIFFFDKLERCQFFIDNILETADQPLSGRLLAHLLQSPLNDGGQWDMLVNLIAKYGVVPKSTFPEAYSSTASRLMNRFLTNRLRTFARDLRTILARCGGDPTSREVQEAKANMLAEVQRELVVFFGAPPQKFTWKYADKDGKQHVVRDITPQNFYKDFCEFDMAAKVSLINDPRNEYYQLYTVDKLGNMVGGRRTTYINVPIEVLKKYARSQLEEKEPVWFGCDVGKHSDRTTCVMDTALLDYQLVFGAAPDGLNKRERLEYGESLMTHAMVFVGFDRDETDPDGKVASWQVENSWGEKGPDKGRWLMTDSWFNEFVYQIVVDVGKLDEVSRAVLSQEPHVLPAWDPMGALASL